MAQVKLLKIHSTGVPVEFGAGDDITLASFTVESGGPVLSGTGLDLNAQDISDIKNVSFNNSATATIAINSTTFLADNMMFETKENSMAVEAAILFPVVTDDVDELDAFRLPAIAGVPSATPADGGEGYLVWDSTGKRMFAWDGSSWDDLSTVSAAKWVQDTYTADEALTAMDAVYLSAADNVSKAKSDADATSRLLGFAVASAIDTASVEIRKFGALDGFTGLTAGSRYFLSPATAGLITSTTPVGAGNVIVQAGYAKNTTTLDIQIQQLGRRA